MRANIADPDPKGAVCMSKKYGKKSLTAAHSYDHMFSLYFDFVILVISGFGFEGWIWVLIASVPGLCMLFTLIRVYTVRYSMSIFKRHFSIVAIVIFVLNLKMNTANFLMSEM